MSVVMSLVGVALIIAPTTDATTKGVGVSLLLTVSTAWFVPGAARQIAAQIKQQVQDIPGAVPTPPTAPPGA